MNCNHQGTSQAESIDGSMEWEASGKDIRTSQAESESQDKKPTAAEQEVALKQLEGYWQELKATETQGEEIRSQWNACTTYSAMLQSNRDFVHGRLHCIPTIVGILIP